MTDDKTITMIRLALDASLMRQTAIAHNVANVNTKDFSAVSVHFEEQLRQASFDKPVLGKIEPYYQSTSKPVALDEQMALSIKNSTHYQALIKGLNQKIALMNMALQGNN